VTDLLDRCQRLRERDHVRVFQVRVEQVDSAGRERAVEHALLHNVDAGVEVARIEDSDVVDRASKARMVAA
jgi:hypothetical protein